MDFANTSPETHRPPLSFNAIDLATQRSLDRSPMDGGASNGAVRGQHRHHSCGRRGLHDAIGPAERATRRRHPHWLLHTVRCAGNRARFQECGPASNFNSSRRAARADAPFLVASNRIRFTLGRRSPCRCGLTQLGRHAAADFNCILKNDDFTAPRNAPGPQRIRTSDNGAEGSYRPPQRQGEPQDNG